MSFSLDKRISNTEKTDAKYTLRTLRKGLLVLEALEALKRHVRKAGEEIST